MTLWRISARIYWVSFQEVTEIVKGVDDGDGAKNAIKEGNDLKPELEKLTEKIRNLEEDSSEEEKKESEKAMPEKPGKEMMKAVGELQGELAKLPTFSTIGAADVKTAMEELMKLVGGSLASPDASGIWNMSVLRIICVLNDSGVTKARSIASCIASS